MTFSALLILIFHLWINITNFQIEVFIRQLCVIGVDLFFFISAYSIAKKEKIDYKIFIVDRFIKIYLKFIIFAIIGAIYFKWSIIRFIKIILGIELFIRGGGSFLWFIPAIMIIYMILPLYIKVDSKHPKITSFVTILVYLIISISISLFTTYSSIFILTNRIPIILLGYYFAKYNVMEYLNNNKIKYWIVTITIIILGIIISYLVYINHFKVSWFKDLFYILFIPFSIGLVLLLDKIKANKISILISSITLELYAIQMIFGFKLANIIFKFINIKLLSNILTIIVLIIIALLIKNLFNLIESKYKNFI